jgi:hypothetical protein
MRVQTWENKGVSVGFQEKAVIEEYRKAKVAEHALLAECIRSANPDLTKEFDKVDKAL